MNSNEEEDANKIAKAYMETKSKHINEMFEGSPEMRNIMEKIAMGRVQDLANPESMFKMGIAQIDACILQLQSAREILLHSQKMG